MERSSKASRGMEEHRAFQASAAGAELALQGAIGAQLASRPELSTLSSMGLDAVESECSIKVTL